MSDLSEETFVRKSNPLIEAKFSEKFSAREMDLLTVLCATIEENAGDLAVVRFKLTDLMTLFGISGNSAYSMIRDTSKKLLSRVIEIYDKENKCLIQHQILSSAKYFGAKGYAEYKFHEELRPYLLDIKGFAKYRMKYSFKLETFSAKRLYELLVQYSGFSNERLEWERKIDLLEIRGYLGVKKEEYLLYGHFKQRIVLKLVDEINNKSNIRVSIEEIKDGKKVISLVFKVKKITQDVEGKIVEENKNWDAEVLAKLINIGVTKRTAEKIVVNNEAGYILFAIGKYEQIAKTKTGRKIENPAGLLVSMILSNELEIEFAEQNKKIIEEKKKQELEKKKQEQEKVKERLSDDYSSYRKKTIESFISFNDGDAIKSRFLKYIDGKVPAPLLNGFLKYGWNFAGTINHVVDFLVGVEEMPILTKDKFFKKHGLVIE